MGIKILLILLGIPITWLENLTYDKIKSFSEKIETVPLQNLFVDVFFKSLKRSSKGLKGIGVRELIKAIRANKTEFINIFSINVTNFKTFLSALKDDTFNTNVAEEIVNNFKVHKNFKEIMVIIVRDCLRDYQPEFLKSMTEKQAMQLIVLLQGQNLDIVLEALKQTENNIISEFKKTVKQVVQENNKKIEPKKKDRQIKSNKNLYIWLTSLTVFCAISCIFSFYIWFKISGGNLVFDFKAGSSCMTFFIVAVGFMAAIFAIIGYSIFNAKVDKEKDKLGKLRIKLEEANENLKNRIMKKTQELDKKLEAQIEHFKQSEKELNDYINLIKCINNLTSPYSIGLKKREAIRYFSTVKYVPDDIKELILNFYKSLESNEKEKSKKYYKELKKLLDEWKMIE